MRGARVALRRPSQRAVVVEAGIGPVFEAADSGRVGAADPRELPEADAMPVRRAVSGAAPAAAAAAGRAFRAAIGGGGRGAGQAGEQGEDQAGGAKGRLRVRHRHLIPARMRPLTVTAKGQVTLKREVLEHLGVHPGDRISVLKLPDGRIKVKAAQPAARIADAFDLLKREGGASLSVDEIGAIAAEGWAGRR